MSELVTQAYAKGNQGEFDLLTAIGELPESIETVHNILKLARHPVQGMRDFVRGYSKRKGFWKKASHGMDQSSQFWMLYRYGIMPLFYQYNDLMQMQKHKRQSMKRYASRDDVSDSLIESVHLPKNPYRASHYPMWHDPIDLQRSIYVTDRYSVVLKRCYSLADLQGRRWTLNPFTTMWELTTLSFVVDWLIHVGDTITAFSPTVSQSSGHTEASYLIERQELTVKSGILDEHGEWYEHGRGKFVQTATSGPFVMERAIYSRTAHNSVWGRGSIPVGLEINVKRAIDGFALSWPSLRSFFSGVLQEVSNIATNHRRTHVRVRN